MHLNGFIVLVTLDHRIDFCSNNNTINDFLNLFSVYAIPIDIIHKRKTVERINLRHKWAACKIENEHRNEIWISPTNKNFVFVKAKDSFTILFVEFQQWNFVGIVKQNLISFNEGMLGLIFLRSIEFTYFLTKDLFLYIIFCQNFCS